MVNEARYCDLWESLEGSACPSVRMQELEVNHIKLLTRREKAMLARSQPFSYAFNLLGKILALICLIKVQMPT